MAKKKSTIPKNESKRDRFKRVVTPRVNKALKMIALVANQAGAAYEYKPEDIESIITVLRDAVTAVESKYLCKGEQSVGFKLR